MSDGERNCDTECAAFHHQAPSRLFLAQFAKILVRSFEALGLRGAPTLLLQLSKVRALRQIVAVAQVGSHRITFPAYDAYWARHLWANAPYELDVEQIFRKLGRGRVLLDCGANIGYWSVRIDEFGFTCVIAVEANRDLMPFLTENLRVNQVPGTAIHAAVYSVSGQQLFLGGTDAHAQGAIASEGMPVTSISIADLCKDVHRGRGIVAKLDVEGAEIEALKGAAEIADLIFVYEDFAQHQMRVTREMLARGMSVFAVSPSGACRAINSVQEAIAFNQETAVRTAPSNLVACIRENARQIKKELET